MTEKKKIILWISPQTHVRATKGDAIFFRIPREKLYPRGLERLKRLERYNEYKVDLLTEAKKNNFYLPPTGLHITFFIPVPYSWSKKKKNAHHGMIHQSRPDIDNLTKAFFDSLVAEDKFIGNITLTKRWVNYPRGWIQCEFNDEPNQILVEVPLKDAAFSKNA